MLHGSILLLIEGLATLRCIHNSTLLSPCPLTTVISVSERLELCRSFSSYLLFMFLGIRAEDLHVLSLYTHTRADYNK
jgi:hypothetical protein